MRIQDREALYARYMLLKNAGYTEAKSTIQNLVSLLQNDIEVSNADLKDYRNEANNAVSKINSIHKAYMLELETLVSKVLDSNSQKTAVALVGLETIQDKNGNPKFSVTFLNNMETWKKEHPEFNLKILDGRSYKDLDNPMLAIWEDLKAIEKIDMLIYSGHSDNEMLYMISRFRRELEDDQRFITFNTCWEGINFSENAMLYLYGCQAGGLAGKRLDWCIAQDVANKTNKTVWAYISKSYQKEGPKGVYHQVSDDRVGFVRFQTLL